MNRPCLSATLLLSLSAASTPPGQMPDVNEAGRTAAGLSDWQTMAYFLMFVIVVVITDRLIASWQSRSAIAKLAGALDRLADATESRATDIKVTLALMQATDTDIKANQGHILQALQTVQRLCERIEGKTT